MLLAVAGVACGPPDGGQPSRVQVDSSGVLIVVSGAPAEEWSLAAAPVLKLGRRDGGPEEFHEIIGVELLPGGRIVVANGGSEELRFFTTAGEFIGAVGGAGHGPDEFEGLSWLARFQDSLLTYDWGNDRLSVRSATGSLSRLIRLDWSSGIIVPRAVLADGTLLSLTVRHMTEITESGTLLETALVSRHDPTGALIDSLARLPFAHRVVHREGNVQTTVGLPIGATGSVTASGSGFCYTFGAEFEVRCFDASGALTLIHRVAVAPRELTPAHIETLFQREVEAARDAGNEARVSALHRARDGMDFPRHFPAFAELRGDDRGRVWAREFALPDDPNVEWWVFSESGWVGRLETDRAFRVMDIEGGLVLGVWRDALGIEHIEMYEVGAADT